MLNFGQILAKIWQNLQIFGKILPNFGKKIGKKSYVISSLKEAEKHGLLNISYLPFSIKVLLENLIRNEDGKSVTREDILEFSKSKFTLFIRAPIPGLTVPA